MIVSPTMRPGERNDDGRSRRARVYRLCERAAAAPPSSRDGRAARPVRLAGIAGATLRLFRHGSPRLTSKPGFEASWCNGAAGAVLLWSKSYACLGDDVSLRVARRAARSAVAASGQMSSLCCGDVGVAFAALAMDRIDADPRWRRHARLLAAHVIAPGPMPWPFGLFQGYPGSCASRSTVIGMAARSLRC